MSVALAAVLSLAAAALSRTTSVSERVVSAAMSRVWDTPLAVASFAAAVCSHTATGSRNPGRYARRAARRVMRAVVCPGGVSQQAGAASLLSSHNCMFPFLFRQF